MEGARRGRLSFQTKCFPQEPTRIELEWSQMIMWRAGCPHEMEELILRPRVYGRPIQSMLEIKLELQEGHESVYMETGCTNLHSMILTLFEFILQLF